MKERKINIIIEKEYESLRWCMDTKRGLVEAAAKHKAHCEIYYDEKALLSADPSSSLNDIVMVLGTTESWLVSLLSALSLCKTRILLVSNSPIDQKGYSSTVLFNRVEAMIDTMRYLSMAGRKKCALLGFNQKSSSDVKRYKAFFENKSNFGFNADEKGDLYLNNGSLAECASRLFCRLDCYDAIICANDPVAVYLMREALQQGYDIPEQLYIIGFGNSVITEMTKPSITTLYLDYYEVGKQAVNAYLYLNKHPEISSMDVFVSCRIIPRESTNFQKALLSDKPRYYSGINSQDLFFDDSDIKEFFILEHFFEQCDEIDLEIIKGLIEKTRYESLAVKLHISEYTLKYRLKKIFSATKTSDRNSFYELIRKYNIKV